MSRDSYDVLVIGAGIHGVGVAQAAAARGYRTLVLERERPAAGTSSRSSKLIHGGLRYLATGQFSLVSSALRERELLLRLAPNLVKRVSFFIPTYRDSHYGPLRIRIGLSVYALLGGLIEPVRFRKLSRTEWDGLDGLTTKGLRAVFRYYDAQTDDVALTKAVLRSAQQLGAECRYPAIVERARRIEDGYDVEFTKGEGHVERVSARVVVNAGGPWINDILGRVDPAPPRYAMELVQGTHLLLPCTMIQGVYYLEALRDRRPLFVMPWPGGTLLGTTERRFDGTDPALVSPSEDEETYLLETHRHYFPEQACDPIARFAGLRVLPAARGTFGARRRETALITDTPHAPRLVTIAGGKLTTYRLTAQRVLQRIAKSLPAPRIIADTAKLTLNG